MDKYEIVFESDNLYYVKVSELLINDYLEMINNHNVNKFLSFKEKKYTYKNELEWVKNKLSNNDIVFSIIEKVSNKFVGNIEIMETKGNIADIGIVITESMQNNHYGSEAIKRFINYCKNDLEFDNVELSVYSHNLKAIHCYEKLGFIEYKRDKKVGKYNNEYVDDIYMKLI